MKKRTKFLVGVLAGLSLTLTGCGHKLTCTNDTGVSLVKKLYFENVIEPLALSAKYKFSFSDNQDVQDVIGWCKNHSLSPRQLFNAIFIRTKFTPKVCQFFLQDVAKLRSYDANKYVDIKDVFMDKKDEESKTVYCHATVYVKDPQKDKWTNGGNVQYKLQESENNDEIEATILNLNY